MSMGILPAKRSAEATTESAEATTESAKRYRNTEFQENETDCVVAQGKASGDGHKNISTEKYLELDMDTDDDDLYFDSPGSIRNFVDETTRGHTETIPIRSFTNCRKAYCALCDEDTGHFDDECPERCSHFLGDEQCFKKAHGDDDHYYLVFTGYCANCEASKLGYCRKHGF